MNIAVKRPFFVKAVLALLAVVGGGLCPSAASADDASPVAQEQTVDGQGVAGGGGLVPGAMPSQQQSLSDLTLGNFFSAGWDDTWATRTRATGTPDMPLLRVLNNDLYRLFRTNFYENVNVNSAARKDLVDFDGFMDFSFNRRVMIEIDGGYQWADGRPGHGDVSGGVTGLLTRVKIIDTESSELSVNFKVSSPNFGLSVADTTVTYGISGFEDLSYFFCLDRVGLYYHLLFDTPCGPAPASAQPSDVQCDVSVAKTFTGADAPVFKRLSVFEENFMQTITEGPTNGRTYFTVTPGMRFNFGPCDDWKMGSANALCLGVDLPVSSYQPWSTTWRLSYIKNF